VQVIKAMRPVHVLKNLIIFVPLFSLGNFASSDLFIFINIFLGFSIVVSSTYILNDIIDIESDKLHPTKKFRPVASEVVPRYKWKIISIMFFIIGNTWLFLINPTALIFSVIYCLITISYSIKLKYLKFLDLISISLLFVIRILIGSAPLSMPPSMYIIIFVFFTSIGIIAGKKFSILNNEDIKNSKIQKFLKNSYSHKELLVTIRIGFFISLTTYLTWISFVKSDSISNAKFYSLILSFICLLFFKYYFFVNTKKNITEDIFEFIESKKLLFIITFLFLAFSLYGLL